MRSSGLLAHLAAPLLALGIGPQAQAGDWSLRPQANLQYDWTRVDGDLDQQLDGWRRSRVGLAIGMPSAIDARVEFDIHSRSWTDAFLRHRHGAHQLRIGQFKQPIFLDELSSDRNTAFTEQGLPASFAIARRIGIDYSYSWSTFRLALSRYDGTLAGTNKGVGWAGRLVWLAHREGDTLLHLAAALAVEDPADGQLRLRSRLESTSKAPSLLDTGRLSGVRELRREGIEMLALRGPLAIQAEFLRAHLRRDSGPGASLPGWYAQASYFIGDDRRRYKDGVVDSPDLGEDGRGLELSLRLSRLDLDDGAVQGGTARNLSLGATWYFSPQLRLMANWVHSDSRRRGQDLDPRYLNLRVQVGF